MPVTRIIASASPNHSSSMGHMLEFPINVYPVYAGIPYQNVLWFSSSGIKTSGGPVVLKPLVLIPLDSALSAFCGWVQRPWRVWRVLYQMCNPVYPPYGGRSAGPTMHLRKSFCRAAKVLNRNVLDVTRRVAIAMISSGGTARQAAAIVKAAGVKGCCCYSTSPRNENRPNENHLDQSLSFSQKNRN